MAKIDRALRHVRRHLAAEESILGCSLAVLDAPDTPPTKVVVAATTRQVVVAERQGRVCLACPYERLAHVSLHTGRLTTKLRLACAEQDLHMKSSQDPGALEAVATIVRERRPRP